MKKVIISLVLSCMSLFLFVGCNNNSPAKLVESYFDNVKNNKDENMLEYANTLAEDFNKQYSESQLSNEIIPTMANFYSKFDATIISETINDNKATVKVELYAPSMTKVLNSYLEKSMSTTLSSYLQESLSTDQSVNSLDNATQNELIKKSQSDLIDVINNADSEIRFIDVTVDKINNKWMLLPDGKLFLEVLGLPSFGL